MVFVLVIRVVKVVRVDFVAFDGMLVGFVIAVLVDFSAADIVLEVDARVRLLAPEHGVSTVT